MPLLGALVLGIAVLACLAVVLGVHRSVLQLSDPGLGMTPFGRHDGPEAWAAAEEIAPWPIRRGFEFLGAWCLHANPQSLVFAWAQPDGADFLCQYQVAGRVQYDLVTLFGSEVSLSTSSTKDAFVLPQAPGHFVQAWTTTHLDTLWMRHQEARSLVAACHGRPMERPDRPFDEIVLGAIRKQVAYVRSLPLWPLRGPYWYFVSREVRKNRPLGQLYRLEPGAGPRRRAA